MVTFEPRVQTENAGALSEGFIAELRREFAANRANKIAQNAVVGTSIDTVALDHDIAVATVPSFSHKLDDWAVTNQRQSGRCWMFAGLNLFRVGAMKKMGVKEFEFSQNYTMFWDKFERANYL